MISYKCMYALRFLTIAIIVSLINKQGFLQFSTVDY